MGVRIIAGEDECCFYCSTSMWAFGPVMGTWEEANLFLKWLRVDPRILTDGQLEGKYSEFRREYGCEYCSIFFDQFAETYLFNGKRYCEECAKKQSVKNCLETKKEWRNDEESLEFVKYGVYSYDEED